MYQLQHHKQLPIPSDTSWDRFSFKRYMPSWFNSFIHGCKNLIIWLPTIWKDRNWDSHYTYEVLKKKLLLQRKEIVNNNRHTDVWRQNRDITICLNLIERVQTDYYGLEHMDYEDMKIDFVKIEGKQYEGEDLYEMKKTILSQNFAPHFAKYKRLVKSLKANGFKDMGRPWDVNDDSTNALLMGDVNQKRAKNLLFKILSERIEWWWD